MSSPLPEYYLTIASHIRAPMCQSTPIMLSSFSSINLCVIHCVAILQFLIVSQLVKLHTLIHKACQKSYIKALIVIFDILGIEA